jgi:PAS domain S-box-containing protein
MDSQEPDAMAAASTVPSRAVKASYDAGAMALLVLSAVILLGVFALVVITDNESRRISDQLRTSRSVESASHELAMLLRTIQSARRGFAVTQDRALLSPYDAALAMVPAKAQALRELVADDPERRRAFDAFSASLRPYLDLLAGYVAADVTRGFDRARLVATFDEGERALQELLDRLAALGAVEQQILRAAQADLDGTRARATLWNTIGILAAVLLLTTGSVILASAKQLVARTARAYQRLVEGLPIAVVGVAPKGRVTMWNKTAEAQLGYGADEVLGKQNPAVPPDLLPTVLSLRERVLRGEVIAGHLGRAVRKDGREIEVLVSLAPMIGLGGTPTGIVVALADVSRQRREEAERLQREREHRETLVREVHHRIKNHLQGIAGLLQQQVQHLPWLELVVRPVRAQVLSIAKVYGLRGRMEGREHSLADMVRAIVDTVREISASEVLMVEEPEEPSFAVSDDEAVPVALIFGELLQNALKHGGGGPVALRLTAQGGGRTAVLEVANSGRLPDTFDPERGQGIGDGLQLALAMMPRAGAALAVEQRGPVVAARLALSSPVVRPMFGEPAGRSAA